MNTQDTNLRCSATAVKARHIVSAILFTAAIVPSACANPVENPSMEGSFVTQGALGDVAEDWIGWIDRRYSLEGEFSESGAAHTGSKSQRIAWDEPYNTSLTGGSSFGYEGIYQQIHSLQPGQLYHATAWFKGTMSGSFPVEGASFFSLFGSMGADPDGGTDPGAVSDWPYIWMQWSDPHFGDIVFPAWTRLGTVFSANGNTATVYVRMSGSGTNYTEFYDLELGHFWQAHPWHVYCYIDDVVVEPMEIGPGSSVQATSPIPANGADRCEVTMTILDGSGQPLHPIPPSEIVVGCTGSSNTIVGPTSATNPNGVATAYITSRAAESKTISVTVFGSLLSDTPVVEFTGSFGPYWYVDTDASGANDGSSWANAFNDLQDALAMAQPGDEIWVAQGTYTPGSNRSDTFQLKSGVALRGGYAGFGEPDPNARDTGAYETILSGDCNGDDGVDFANNDENSYHVVTGSGTDATTVLDGFTITAGNANGSSSLDQAGGGTLVNNGSPTVTHCTFVGNSSEYGAGVGNYNASASLTHCFFRSNQAEISGGGMANDDGGRPTVDDCEFRENSAEFGGGMRNHTCDPVVTNCTFSGNVGTYGGGVRNVDSNAEFSHCTFTGNSAGQVGGGMVNEGTGSPTVADCTFSDNFAAVWGGGVYNVECDGATLTECTFSGNSATYAGGGILDYSSDSTVINSTFTDNSAAYAGGGVFHYDSGSVIANCLFRSNSTDADGGGIAVEGSTTALTNCTFSGNTAGNGSVLACYSEEQEELPSNVTLANCILWNGQESLSNNDGSTITVTYSDVQGGWSGTGNINADPLFVNPAGGDYHLGAGSPCIDAGDNDAVPAGVTTDVDGLVRFFDDPATSDTGSGTPPIVDMGAYEFGSSVSTVAVYRFWSGGLGHHFYTISEPEKNKLLNKYSHVWSYEGPVYYALSGDSDPSASPVYRFWSDRYNGHFYTINESEKNKLINSYSHVWTYEGPKLYAYAEGQQPAGTSPVYRFWSDALNGHFYTISEDEKNKLVSTYSYIWTYEGIAWYAYE